MPQKYTLEYLKNNKVAVNCRTVEEMQKVCEIVNPIWSKIAPSLFDLSEDKSTIEFYFGSWSYSDIDYISREGYTIIPASEFLDWQEEPKEPSPTNAKRKFAKCIEPFTYGLTYEKEYEVARDLGGQLFVINDYNELHGYQSGLFGKVVEKDIVKHFAPLTIESKGDFQFHDHTNATILAQIRQENERHAKTIDELLKQIK